MLPVERVPPSVLVCTTVSSGWQRRALELCSEKPHKPLDVRTCLEGEQTGESIWLWGSFKEVRRVGAAGRLCSGRCFHCRCDGCEAVLLGIEQQVLRANQYKENHHRTQQQVEAEVKRGERLHSSVLCFCVNAANSPLPWPGLGAGL